MRTDRNGVLPCEREREREKQGIKSRNLIAWWYGDRDKQRREDKRRERGEKSRSEY
jgi:hypothetical protein